MDVKGRYIFHTSSHMVLSHEGTSDTTHALAARLTVTLNGEPSALSDLRADDEVVLLGDPASNVDAKRIPVSVPVSVPKSIPQAKPDEQASPVPASSFSTGQSQKPRR